MKYNNDILDKIAEMYDTDNHNDLGLENITNGYLEMMKNPKMTIFKK